MAATLTQLRYEGNSSENFVHIILNLFSESECASIIRQHRDLRQSNLPIGTIRTREVFGDAELATRLWGRIAHFYSGYRVRDEDGQWWRAKGLNTKLRVSKYERGGRFTPHFDYRRLVSINEQSFMSVNIYLNTVPEYYRGATRILQHPSPGTRVDLNGQDPLAVLAKIQPVLGTASIFGDKLWHDGEELMAGAKYLLRTDVMCEREEPLEFEAVYGSLGILEKVNKAFEIANALEEGGNDEEADVWFQKAGELTGDPV